jgi:hypothetical protein
MASRRKRSEGEHLLAQGPREAPPPKAAEEYEDAEARRRTVLAGVIVFVLLAGLHLVAHLSIWATLALALATLVLNRRYLPRAGRGIGGRSSLLRMLFLLWLAVAVAVTVLVAISGFYRLEELILLTVVWGILAGLWLAERLDRFVRAH